MIEITSTKKQITNKFKILFESLRAPQSLERQKRRVRKGLTLAFVPRSDLFNPLEIRRHWRLPMRPRIGSLTGLNHVVYCLPTGDLP